MAMGPAWTENPYTYASAAPTGATDPTGLCSWRVYDCVDDAWGQLVDAGAAAGDAIAAGGAWTAERVRDITVAARAIATKGIGALAAAGSSMSKAIWYAVRAAVNAQVSGFARAYAAAQGATCRALRNGLTGCFGIDSLAGSAMTIGNIVLVREKTIDDDLLDHEEAHADQWALFGLATPATPLVGQAAFAASYGAFQAVFGSCGNLYENWADLSKGNYEC
jgi:hypothetical protein